MTQLSYIPDSKKYLAYQWKTTFGTDILPEWLQEANRRNLLLRHAVYGIRLYTDTGFQRVKETDWILQGIKGEFHVFSNDVFNLMFSIAGEQE